MSSWYCFLKTQSTIGQKRVTEDFVEAYNSWKFSYPVAVYRQVQELWEWQMFASSSATTQVYNAAGSKYLLATNKPCKEQR